MKELEGCETVPNSEYVKDIIRKADIYSEEAPVVVTDKNKTFATDNHYYCSMNCYWWPNPQNPGHNNNRDGCVNPERDQYDRNKPTLFPL